MSQKKVSELQSHDATYQTVCRFLRLYHIMCLGNSVS